MKTTKAQAKQDAQVYRDLLQDRAVISDITASDFRGEQKFSFDVYDPKIPYQIECVGIKELALVLSAMWAAYYKARFDLGIRDDLSNQQYIEYD